MEEPEFEGGALRVRRFSRTHAAAIALACLVAVSACFALLAPRAAAADGPVSTSDSPAYVPGTADAIVDVALSQPDGVPEGGYYNKYNFYSGCDWCAHFAAWCARTSGASFTAFPENIYYCDGLRRYYQSRGEWRDWTYAPKLGDLVFYSYDASGVPTHVGIVVGLSPDAFLTREGNVGDCEISSFWRRIGQSDTGGWGRIVGFATPSYAPDAYRYEDVPFDAWYVDRGYLDYVSDTGLMSGSSTENIFMPEENVSRGQTAVILYRMATGDMAPVPPSEGPTPFTDVPDDSYYARAITWACENGVVTGDTDDFGNLTGTFRPDDHITRAELATMIARLADACGAYAPVDASEALSGLQWSDPIPDYAYDAMAWCAANGVITGSEAYDPPDLLPADKAKRCEVAKVATVLYRDVL